MPQNVYVDNRLGERSRFSVDRFLGTLVQVGLAPMEARRAAEAVETQLQGSEAGVISTDDLRYLALEIATKDLHELAITAALASSSGLRDRGPQTAIAPVPAVRLGDLRGMLAPAMSPLLAFAALVRRSDPKLAELFSVTVAIGAAAAEGVYAEQVVPTLTRAWGHAGLLGTAELAALQQRLMERVVPLVNARQLALRAGGLLLDVAGQGGVNLETADQDVVTRLMTRVRDELHISEVVGPPEGSDYVKIGALERPAVIPPAGATASSGGSPLWCYRATDRGDLFPSDDEPTGAEMRYVDPFIQTITAPLGPPDPGAAGAAASNPLQTALQAPEDSVGDGQEVGRDWLIRSTMDQELPKGYWLRVPDGLAVHTYTWYLSESDGLWSSDRFKRLVEEARKQIEKNKSDWAQKVGDAAKAAVQGTQAAPLSNLAGQIARIGMTYVLDAAIQVLAADAKFHPCSVFHGTIRAPAGSAPLSVVCLRTEEIPEGQVALLATFDGFDASGAPKPFINLYPLNPALGACQAWYGESNPPGSVPAIRIQVARNNVAVLWRGRSNRDGFGALVPLSEHGGMPSIYPGRLPGRYVAILRAEVYLRTNAQLNAMISE